jgi:hypothetical protein
MSVPLVSVALFALSVAAAQAQTASVPRMADGKPNLTGVWQALGTAHWDIQDHSPQAGPFHQLGAIGAIPGGRGIVDGNEIPYQPWAAAKKKENFANRLTLDPEMFSLHDAINNREVSSRRQRCTADHDIVNATGSSTKIEMSAVMPSAASLKRSTTWSRSVCGVRTPVIFIIAHVARI